MPSNLPATNATPMPLASVISANVWPSSSTPPQLSVSVARIPSHAPEPYSMWNTVPFSTYVDDADASYLGLPTQFVDEQSVDGTQRLAEPVSKITSNVCAGVPSEISPARAADARERRNEDGTILFVAPVAGGPSLARHRGRGTRR